VRPVAPPSRLLFREEDVEEKFVRGGGKGGQAVAKSSNAVQLHHVPSGLRVRCHATRSQELNRRLAREELQARLEVAALGAGSKRARAGAKRAKRAAKRRARAAGKYAPAAGRGGAAGAPAAAARRAAAAEAARAAAARARARAAAAAGRAAWARRAGAAFGGARKMWPLWGDRVG